MKKESIENLKNDVLELICEWCSSFSSAKDLGDIMEEVGEITNNINSELDKLIKL